MSAIRPSPCRFCPYRRDVPSGVWSAEDYAKLRAYDDPGIGQPVAPFACHETPKLFCSGWAQCHGNEILSLRIQERIRGKDCTVPPKTTLVFRTGNEAADHGMRDIDRPGKKARAAMAILIPKIERRKANRPLTNRLDISGERGIVGA